MAELLALRCCTCPPVSSYYSGSAASIDGRPRGATSLGRPRPSLVHQLSIRQGTDRTSGPANLRTFSVRAGLGDGNGNNKPPLTSLASQDWKYLGKFMAACTGGAIAIKYGSVLVPSITEPNLVQALIMITTPVLVSVALLSVASSQQKLGS